MQVPLYLDPDSDLEALGLSSLVQVSPELPLLFMSPYVGVVDGPGPFSSEVRRGASD
jgi:hypothetical protein